MSIQEELNLIESKDGILRPAAVVEFARNKKTALHHLFTWDDTEAANQYRLWQARSIIKARVTIIEVEQKQYNVRAFVSLSPDRKEAGGGYRSITTVAADEVMRSQLLKDALGELGTFRRKYQGLRELARVFTEIEAVIGPDEVAEKQPALV